MIEKEKIEGAATPLQKENLHLQVILPQEAVTAVLLQDHLRHHLLLEEAVVQAAGEDKDESVKTLHFGCNNFRNSRLLYGNLDSRCRLPYLRSE